MSILVMKNLRPKEVRDKSSVKTLLFLQHCAAFMKMSLEVEWELGSRTERQGRETPHVRMATVPSRISLL